MKIAINGFGRIGRSVVRALLQRDDIELVAINDLMDINEAAYLIRNDTIRGVFEDVEVSDFEIKKNRPVYSIETIEYFKPDYFIIGSDNLKTLDKWHKIDEILKKTEFIVATRGDIDEDLAKKYGINKFIKVNIPISSTEIRNGRFEYLPKKIENEIKEFYGQNSKN